MELDIVELDCLRFGGSALSIVVSLIIQPKLQVRHACKLTVALHHPDYLRFDNIVVRTN